MMSHQSAVRPADPSGLPSLAQVLERLSMVKGLEATEDAATFLALCAERGVAEDGLAPLCKAGLVAQDGRLTPQGAAVRAWLFA